MTKSDQKLQKIQKVTKSDKKQGQADASHRESEIGFDLCWLEEGDLHPVTVSMTIYTVLSIIFPIM